jgi:hypothetical protein
MSTWLEEKKKKEALLKETYDIVDFGKDKILYNKKTRHYYKPLYPSRVTSYGYSRVNPQKEFPRLLSNYWFDAFYDANKLNLIFELHNGNGSDKETVQCEEYFPAVSLKTCNTKEELISAVIVESDKNNDLKNKIEDVHRTLQLYFYCNFNDTLADLDEDALKAKARDLQKENERLQDVLHGLKLQLNNEQQNK